MSGLNTRVPAAGVVDPDRALLEQVLGDVDGGVVRGAPPGGGGTLPRRLELTSHAAVGARDLDRVVVQDLGQELPHVVGCDPGRAELGLDLSRPEIRRQHPLQRGHVDRVRGVGGGGLPGRVELVAHVAGQVLRRRDQPTGVGIGKDQLTQLRPGGGLVDPKQPGDLAQPDLTVAVQADRHRVGGGVGTQPWSRGTHDPAAEDLGLADRAGTGSRCSRALTASAYGSSRNPPGNGGHATDRTEGGDVVVVDPVEVGTQPPISSVSSMLFASASSNATSMSRSRIRARNSAACSGPGTCGTARRPRRG